MGPRPSPVILCMQNSVISTRITSLYWSQTSPVFFACKTAWLAPEFKSPVSMSPVISPHVKVPGGFACKTATLGPELQVCIGPRPHLWFFAFKTATLAPELQVSMGPSPHLWFCTLTTATRINSLMTRIMYAKQSLWVPDLTCRFCMHDYHQKTACISIARRPTAKQRVAPEI